MEPLGGSDIMLSSHKLLWTNITVFNSTSTKINNPPQTATDDLIVSRFCFRTLGDNNGGDRWVSTTGRIYVGGDFAVRNRVRHVFMRYIQFVKGYLRLTLTKEAENDLCSCELPLLPCRAVW